MLELDRKDTGRIAFGKTLGVLASEERRSIVAFSQLKNELVHEVANIGFTFEAYWKTLDKQQQQAKYTDASLFFVTDPSKRAGWAALILSDT